MGSAELAYRWLDADELERVSEIDRAERIDAIYVQRGSELTLVEGDHSSPPWQAEGDGEHSVANVRRSLAGWYAAGGVGFGAFDGDRLVALGVVVAELRPAVAQLAFLYVTRDFRGLGIGGVIVDELERVARDRGAATMVVSAVPSRNTVRFYVGLGFEPMAEPLSELFEVE